jgi:hypothetical protein
MSHQWKSAAQMLQNFHHTLFISDYNVTPSKICSTNVAEFPLYTLFGDAEGRGYIVYQWLQCQSKRNLRHECRRISIIYPIWGWRRVGLHCLSVTTIYSLLYSIFGDGEGRGYTARLSFNVCQSHHHESATRMPQIFDHRSMSVSHTTRHLRHKCRRFLIIDQCLSVTPPVYSLFGDGEGRGYTVCTLVNVFA